MWDSLKDAVTNDSISSGKGEVKREESAGNAQRGKKTRRSGTKPVWEIRVIKTLRRKVRCLPDRVLAIHLDAAHVEGNRAVRESSETSFFQHEIRLAFTFFARLHLSTGVETLHSGAWVFKGMRRRFLRLLA